MFYYYYHYYLIHEEGAQILGLRCTELLLLRLVVPVLINAQHVFSASVHIYYVKHYTVHIESNLNEHFVQYTGTLSELFMLVCADIILILFIFIVLPCNVLLLCGPL